MLERSELQIGDRGRDRGQHGDIYIRILSNTNIQLYRRHEANTDFTHVLTVCRIRCVYKILEVHTMIHWDSKIPTLAVCMYIHITTTCKCVLTSCAACSCCSLPVSCLFTSSSSATLLVNILTSSFALSPSLPTFSLLCCNSCTSTSAYRLGMGGSGQDNIGWEQGRWEQSPQRDNYAIRILSNTGRHSSTC